MAEKDIWSEWLKHRRFGGNAEHQAQAMKQYKQWALEIVDKAEIFESATVLDIGAGDGLVGLTALEKLGEKGKLILSDISEAALAIPKEIFNKKETPDSRVEFLIAPAENLSPLKERTIDRIVMRSVLLYLEDKQPAFNEIFRVLKHGGIAVLWEPVNQRMVELRAGLFRGYRLDSEPLLSVRPLLEKVNEHSRNEVKQNQSTLTGYNEHDLVHFAIKAGFEEIELEYSLSHSAQVHYSSWEFFFDSAPNPHAKSLRELITDVLTPEEFTVAQSALKKAIEQPSVSTKAKAILILKKNIGSFMEGVVKYGISKK
ncbi:MAG TPA: class I SAM-dependent methyltransferase [Ignavibacteria bacterium]|jgi:ubiquinone/menaquinone biosynthesis C-methylase UbiE